MAKREIERNVEKLIAYKLITSITGTISDRTKRKYDKLGKETSERFKAKQVIPETSNLVGKLGWDDKAVSGARKILLGIEEFNNKYPKYGKILAETIQKHRGVRRAYLEFGLKKGKELDEEIYIEAIKETIEGVSDENALKFYNILVDINKDLRKTRKKAEALYTLLLPE